MSDTLVNDSIVQLGFDLFSIKLYWVASSALWIYEYFITLGDEVKYAWKGKKTVVFWLFFLNRYTTPCFIIINFVAYFSNIWTVDVCNRSGFLEGLQTLILTSTAEIFLTLRVYAITNKSKVFPCLGAMILASQWASLLYVMIESPLGKENPAILLPLSINDLPTLPNIDAYHICMFLSVLNSVHLVEMLLYLSFAFDAIVFLIVMVVTFKSIHSSEFIPLIKTIRRDGVMYFFVLFSSNLAWVLLLLHARPGLKFMHNQPSAVISAIMVNRITLNLKAAYASQPQDDPSWSIRTFGQSLVFNAQPHVSVVELESLKSRNIVERITLEHEVTRETI